METTDMNTLHQIIVPIFYGKVIFKFELLFRCQQLPTYQYTQFPNRNVDNQ